MDLTLPLYRQLFGRFSLLVICFLLTSVAGVSLYFYHSKQLLVVNEEYLPAIEQHNKQQKLLIRQEQLINEITASKNAIEFSRYYQVLNNNLEQLSTLSRKNRQLLEQLMQRLQQQAENVIRLTESSRRNIQLKDSVIIQLTLVADSLSVLIADQASQQNNLYQQVNSDRLTDRVTAIRAKALSKLAINLNRNRELHRLLVDSLVMFSKLDLRYDLIEFDYLQQQSNIGLQKWLANMVDQFDSKSTDENALVEQVVVLNDLLFVEQNTFAKWRGQLRRVQDFRIELQTQHADLAPLVASALNIKLPNAGAINQSIKLQFAEFSLEISEQHYIWLVIAVFISFLVLFLVILYSTRKVLKRFNQNHKAVINEYLNSGSCTGEFFSAEAKQVVSGFEQLSQPKHSEVDYLNLKQQQQLFTTQVHQHSGYAFWQLSQSKPTYDNTLKTILGIESFPKHWRHLFSRNDVSKIIAVAREAKTHNNIQRLLLVTEREKAVSLTIEYINSHWRGSVSSAETLQQLHSQNNQLQAQLQQQTQNEKLNIIRNSDYVIGIIQRLITQKWRGDGPSNEQENDELLQQLLNGSQQQKISAQLRRDDYLLTLSTVNLIDEVHSATINCAMAEIDCNNSVYVSIDEKVNPYVTMESELFHNMIREFSAFLLAQQHNANLDITLKLADVNSAQQIVSFSFVVQTFSDQDAFSQAMALITQIIDMNAELTCTKLVYLRDLMLVFNASDSESVVLDNSGKFTFNLPLAKADCPSDGVMPNQQISKADIRLGKGSVLVIATEPESRQRLCNVLAGSKLHVETMRDLTLFQRQLSIKHLKDNKVDVLLISEEVYRSDYDLIIQHIESLPSKLQPKILISQPLANKSLARTGMFSHCMMPWYANDLKYKLNQLLASKEKSNLLIASEVFGQQQTFANQHKLLLAVKKPSSQQYLIQLLHWLGFDLTVVTQLSQLEQHWQSGQYQVAISEFLPFKLALANTIDYPRGVYAFECEPNVVADFFVAQNIDESWHTGIMPPVLDIQAIIALLSPWLSVQIAQQVEQNNLEQKVAKDNQEQAAQATDDVQSTSKTNDETSAENIDKLLDLNFDNTQQDIQAPAAFDLNRYAQNQGSAEIAAIMLDDYLADIESLLIKLEQAIIANNIADSQRHLKSIIHLSRVIAAEPLLQQCQACHKLLLQVDGSLSSQQSKQLKQQIVQLTSCLSQLVEFAESI